MLLELSLIPDLLWHHRKKERLFSFPEEREGGKTTFIQETEYLSFSSPPQLSSRVLSRPKGGTCRSDVSQPAKKRKCFENVNSDASGEDLALVIVSDNIGVKH